MDSEMVTWCLKQFSALGGEEFKKENPHRLVLKFFIFRFYPHDWPNLYLISFPENPKRIKKQIAALSLVKRDRIPKLNDPQWFYLMNIIVFQHSVDEDSKQLTVHNRDRGHEMHHYCRCNAEMRKISTNLSKHRDELFMLQLANSSYARDILYDDVVMSKMGVDYRQVQGGIMPIVRAGRDENLPDKIKELGAMFRFARVDLGKLNMEELERAEVVASNVPEERLLNQPRKKDYAEKFEQLMQQRNKLLETVDERKLLQSYKEGIKETLSWSPPADYKPTRAKLAQNCDTMQEAIAILEEHQLDKVNMHRRNIEKIDSLRKERAALLRTAHRRRLYEDGHSYSVDWSVPSTHNMGPLQAAAVISKLENQIALFQTYQLKAN